MEVKFGKDMLYPIENSVAEIHVKEGGTILYVLRGQLGELDFYSDAIGGIPSVWNSLISDFDELEAIYNFMKEHKDLWFADPPEEVEREVDFVEDLEFE